MNFLEISRTLEPSSRSFNPMRMALLPDFFICSIMRRESGLLFVGLSEVTFGITLISNILRYSFRCKSCRGPCPLQIITAADTIDVNSLTDNIKAVTVLDLHVVV